MSYFKIVSLFSGISAILLLAIISIPVISIAKGVKVKEESAMLKGKKALFIIAHHDFRDEELAKPREILEKNGVRVTLASSSMEKSRGMLGMIVQPDILVNQVQVKDYDLILLVGGGGSEEYWDDADAHRIVQTAVKENKLLAAICIAPVTLANAGVLKNRKATVFSSCVKEIRNKGAIYLNEPVVQDGNIITASGPAAAESFGQLLVQAIRSRD